ncbi:MAG: YabP/YqfC family sporulation protein [Clostridia bacterium]|nr:YabP/YqfC family sporulation protein [Clostridia bacterium]
METISLFLHPYIFIGPEGALVEGVKRIVRWDSECIEMISGRRVRIEGKRLEIEYKSMDSLLVKGRIEGIFFLKERGR